MKSSHDIIFSRTSVRTYTDQEVPANVLTELMDFSRSLGPGPFGNKVRFALIDARAFDSEQMKTLGTYGMIKGARLYLTGAVVPGPGASEDFGWAMESMILKATELGLGTCWLGGTLDRHSFGVHSKCSYQEVLPAASPIGYGLEKPGTKDRIIRGLVGADKRKPFGKLFFRGEPDNPLREEDAGPWHGCLMALRQAPSASNKQPWRLLSTPDLTGWHFYLEEDKTYNRRFSPILLQNMDMGIALCHFQQVAREQGVPGQFMVLKDAPDAGDWIYIGSWIS